MGRATCALAQGCCGQLRPLFVAPSFLSATVGAPCSCVLRGTDALMGGIGMNTIYLASVACGAALGTASLGAVAVHIGERSPVYAVSALQRGLEQHPRTWLGRTLLLHGTAAGCRFPKNLGASFCMPVALLDATSATPTDAIALQWGPEDPGRALWRRLPLVGRFAPEAQTVHWAAPATYRVRITVQPAWYCALPPCYGALVLDTMPH